MTNQRRPGLLLRLHTEHRLRSHPESPRRGLERPPGQPLKTENWVIPCPPSRSPCPAWANRSPRASSRAGSRPTAPPVQAGEPLLELETDKATTVVPAPGSGVLKIGVAEGETVAIGATVGTIEPAGAAAAAAGPSSRPRASRPPNAPTARTRGPADRLPQPRRRRPIRAAAIARSRRRSAGSWPRRTSTSAGSPAPGRAAGSPRGTCSIAGIAAVDVRRCRLDGDGGPGRTRSRHASPAGHALADRLTHSRRPGRAGDRRDRPHRPAPARPASG